MITNCKFQNLKTPLQSKNTLYGNMKVMSFFFVKILFSHYHSVLFRVFGAENLTNI